MALQIYLAILSELMKPEKKVERAAYSEDQSQAICRYFFYTKRLERILSSSLSHNRISGMDYGYSWKMITNDGMDWFEQHLQKYPDQASVYGHYIAFLGDEADISCESFGAGKYLKKAEKALEKLKKLVNEQSDIYDRRNYVRRCSEIAMNYRKLNWAGLIHSKKALKRADELSEEAVTLFEQFPEAEKSFHLEIIVYRTRAQILAAQDKSPEAAQMLWRVFEHIYPEAGTLLDTHRQTFSSMNMLLLEYLFRFRKFIVNGKDKYTIAKSILQYEMGYVRARVNVNFDSRYHWARILQIRAYCKWYEGAGDYEKDLQDARHELKLLAEEQKKDSRGIDGWRYDAKRALDYDVTTEMKF